MWKVPAGIGFELFNASNISLTLTDSETQVLYARVINCNRDVPTGGFVVWGGRALRGADNLISEWKYVPDRRLALYIEECFYLGIKWVVKNPTMYCFGGRAGRTMTHSRKIFSAKVITHKRDA